MRPPVLIVLHGELSTPGRVAIQLRNRDIPLDVRRPRFGDDLPKTLEAHSGAVIFGGPQSANDDDEIVKRERGCHRLRHSVSPSAIGSITRSTRSSAAAGSLGRTMPTKTKRRRGWYSAE